MTADADGDPEYGLSLAGEGDGGDITFEISKYDEFGQLVSVHNDNYSAAYTFCYRVTIGLPGLAATAILP